MMSMYRCSFHEQLVFIFAALVFLHLKYSSHAHTYSQKTDKHTHTRALRQATKPKYAVYV